MTSANRKDYRENTGLYLEALICAAVHDQSLPSDVGSTFAGKPNDSISDLVRLTHALESGFGAKALEHFFVGDAGCLCARSRELLQALCRGKARSDIVDSDAVFAELVRKAFDQTDDGGTHCVRIDEVVNRLANRDRGDRNNAAPLIPLHMREHSMREGNNA